MGGGPVSLTPLEGEPLLDPLLKERLEILKKYPETQQVVLTTNGIALNKFSDQEIRLLLEGLYLSLIRLGLVLSRFLLGLELCLPRLFEFS